jgi:murein DD-endopeptidase MepM/ murein hydrolase activator NlpD
MTKSPGLVLAAVLTLTAPAFAEEVKRKVGSLTVGVDEAAAYPGGMVTVRLRSTRSLGVVYAILDGRRSPFLLTRRGLRALVPVPIGAPAGPTTLGIEVRGRGGRQRFALKVNVAERSYPPRASAIPEVKKAMLSMPGGVRDGRLVQLYLRTVSAKQEWRGAFRPPVAAEPEPSFGCPQTYDAEPPVEGKTDAIWGEYHRGLDYPVPAGTEVSSPAAGTVLFAGPLLLTGETVMIDHGQGVVSVFYHLASTRRRAGDWVDAGAILGSVGETGIAASPHLHWGVYVNGVAVDPRVTEGFAD